MKHYKNPSWIINNLKRGIRNKEMAEICGVSIFTISGHVSRLLNSLQTEQLADLIYHATNPKQLVSPKTLAYEKIKTETPFLHNNHIQGYTASSISYGLTHNEELVSVMTFSKSRYTKKYEYELIRFCSKLDTNVVGGASKLFKHFINQHSPNTIVSYSDKSWNTGNVYTILGFKYSHTSAPNYHYFKPGNTILQSRLQFQKHKLSSKLDNFNSVLSEWDNMKNNGYNRIWDCGNDVFVWSLITD